jgi:Plasmid pRiA4b ORF-3-like protein
VANITGKEQRASYAALTQKVVREAEEPIPFAEIMRRVNRMRRIETRSPEGTIRNAIGQCYLIANTGNGRYGWYPRLLKSSRVRVPLIVSDLKQKRIVFDDEVRELLWPSFFAGQALADREAVDLELPDGEHAPLPLDFFGNGVWGTTGSQEFWKWLRAGKARDGDALIIEALNAETRRYRISLETKAMRDAAAIRLRAEEVERAAREHLWRYRARGMTVWDMAKYLLVAGYYRHRVPPESITPIWNRVLSQLAAVEAVAERRREKGKEARKVYELKITLSETDPPIWRRVLVTDNTTLGDLHWIIQLSMGWTNSHLHQFIIDGIYYSDPEFELDDYRNAVCNEHRTTLAKVLAGQHAQFIYEYDFGDGWQHNISVEKTLGLGEEDIYPRCVAGARACPPEDCGGVWGYADLLSAIRDPSDPEHKEMLESVGGSFDPERCDLEAINWQLKRLADSGG